MEQKIQKHKKNKYGKNDSRRIIDSIKVKFENKFPKNYKNNVAHWGNFSVEELHQTNNDGTQKLLHLDIDFGNVCSLKCSHCFRRDTRFDMGNNDSLLTEEEIINYLTEAKKLGLKSVKFLGRGEPFENSKFLGFLIKLANMGIKASVFTKGHVIGSDELTKNTMNITELKQGKSLRTS